MLFDVAAHWVWVAGGLLLLIAELTSMSFFLIGPGLAALFLGLLMAIAPDLMPPVAQVTLFAVLATAATWTARALLASGRSRRRRPDALNDRVRRLMGRRTRATADFEDGIGHVEIDGQRWRARADHDGPIRKGELVTIVDSTGNDLIVRETPGKD